MGFMRPLAATLRTPFRALPQGVYRVALDSKRPPLNSQGRQMIATYRTQARAWWAATCAEFVIYAAGPLEIQPAYEDQGIIHRVLGHHVMRNLSPAMALLTPQTRAHLEH